MKPFYCFILFAVNVSLGASPRKIQLYSSTNLRGDNLVLESNEIDLELLDFDDKARSVEVNGIWLLYEDEYYNRGRSSRMVTYAWGSNHVLRDLGEIGGRVSSIRYSGEEDLSQSTLSIYEDDGFQGAEIMVKDDEDTLRYKDFGRSLILTGCEPWTLYDKEYFGGNRICVYPASSSSPCRPGFFVEPSKFGYFDKRIASVKRGCYSKRLFVAKPFVQGEARMVFSGESF